MIRAVPTSRWVLMLLTCTLLGGCAIANEKNRRTLNLLDESIAPSSTPARIALAPLVLPLGLGAAMVDQLLVHPSTVIDDAWKDTVATLWSSKGESAFRRGLLFPLMVLATPPFFLGDFFARAALPFDSD